ncbi:MAG: T9SS type A sorting domain-containing protein [Calditrichaeota bacterium]|nr:T9SS type A sorting domain-containing protein [Calditrichota bacterium]
MDGSSDNELLELRIWNSSNNTDIVLISLLENPIYQTDDFIVSDVSVKPEVPMEYHLSEAFPNPFNSTVQLNYEIPEASEVSIKIFDTAGRMVANLLDNEVEAGFHHVLWDGKDATSGVYLISMRTNSYYSTRKVTLIR